MTDPMTTYEAAVEEAEARTDEQIDEARIVEAEGWLLECFLFEHPGRFPVAAAAIADLLDSTWSPPSPSPVWFRRKLSAAYDVLGLSGTLRALARFVEEEERAHRVDR